jgi:hypothetical protein
LRAPHVLSQSASSRGSSQERRSVWMQTRMEDLMKEREEAAEAHALMEL